MNPPETVVQAYDLGLDFFENLTLAYQSDGEIVVETRADGAPNITRLGTGTEPALAFNPLGLFVAFSVPDPDRSEERRIVLRSRLAGQWGDLQRVSAPPGDDRFPRLAIGRGRTPVLVWEKQRASSGSHIWFRRGDEPAVEVDEGTRPSVLLDGAGTAHIFFSREGEVLHAQEDSSDLQGVFLPSSTLTQSRGGEVSAPRAVIGPDQTIYVCFSRDGQVLLTHNADGPFGPLQVVATDRASNPSVVLSSTGALAVVFEKDGDIHSTVGSPFVLPVSTPVLTSDAVESDPAVLLDSQASAMVTFRQGTDLLYTTNAGLPQAGFSAEPLTGEAPLEVRFHDESTGAVTGWFWDFGDDATSRERDPVHVYRFRGEYSVSLRVRGPGGESPVARDETVLVLPPTNEMRVGHVRVFPGQRNVHVPVLATHDRPAQGFTIAATYDPAVIEVRGLEFEDTNIEGLEPELFAVEISADPGDAFVTAGILFDVVIPIHGRTLAPGRGHRIANFVVDVRPDAAMESTTRIELTDNVGQPALSNIFTVNGHTVKPVLAPGGTISISRLEFPPPRFFIRGDSNDDRTVNIADVVATLNHLFAGGPEPGCYDAADASDDGRLDITDAAFTLGFLFKSESYPLPPFPDPGLDPTDDAFPPCLLR